MTAELADEVEGPLLPQDIAEGPGFRGPARAWSFGRSPFMTRRSISGEDDEEQREDERRELGFADVAARFGQGDRRA